MAFRQVSWLGHLKGGRRRPRGIHTYFPILPSLASVVMTDGAWKK